MDFPGGASAKKLPANAGDIRDVGSLPEWGRSPGGGHGKPLQFSCLENPMDRGAWWVTVHGVTKSWIQLKWLSTQAGKYVLYNFPYTFIYSSYVISYIGLETSLTTAPPKAPSVSPFRSKAGLLAPQQAVVCWVRNWEGSSFYRTWLPDSQWPSPSNQRQKNPGSLCCVLSFRRLCSFGGFWVLSNVWGAWLIAKASSKLLFTAWVLLGSSAESLMVPTWPSWAGWGWSGGKTSAVNLRGWGGGVLGKWPCCPSQR